MLCPKCKVEMRAKASYHIEGKKLFLWQQFLPEQAVRKLRTAC